MAAPAISIRYLYCVKSTKIAFNASVTVNCEKCMGRMPTLVLSTMAISVGNALQRRRVVNVKGYINRVAILLPLTMMVAVGNVLPKGAMLSMLASSFVLV